MAFKARIKDNGSSHLVACQKNKTKQKPGNQGTEHTEKGHGSEGQDTKAERLEAEGPTSEE